MLIAQELPPVEVTVEAPADPAILVVSVVAVAIALASLIVTFAQGRVIRKIETREHDWQAADRSSASIEVTRISDVKPLSTEGTARRYHRSDRIRLRNVGRAPARNVVWTIDADVFAEDQRTALDVLFPGEHFDLFLYLSIADPPDTHFTVEWADENGEHETKRLINL